MKNILVCVSGLTPQIITETLYCLSVQRGVDIDELYVITTSTGRDVILGTHERIKYPPLKSEIKQMCQKYKLKQCKFEYNDTHIIVAKDLSIELHDIRDDKQNKLFPNKICEFINQKTKDRETVLYCSISGGRKSMSVDLAFALSLFGRENDKLLHVLTHEENEFKGFYPQNKKEDKDLELAEVPFVKLRSIIGGETRNNSFGKMKYMDIVRFTQEKIKQSFIDKILIDSVKNEITVGDNEPVRLEPAKFKLYKYIIDKKLEGNESVTVQEILKECPHKFSPDTIVQTVSKITDTIQKGIPDIEEHRTVVILGPNTFGYGRYGILADNSKIKILK